MKFSRGTTPLDPYESAQDSCVGLTRSVLLEVAGGNLVLPKAPRRFPTAGGADQCFHSS